MAQAMVDALASGRSLLVFPEGTTADGDAMLPFRNGAFRAAARTGCRVVPIVLRGTREMMPAGRTLLADVPIPIEILEPIRPTDATREGMAAFQPDALTISRGHPWEDRRRFAEAVLDTGHPVHRLAQAFVEKVAQTVEGLGSGALKWSDWNAAFQRLTRCVVFGDKAADDTRLTSQLSELMSAGNGMPGEPAPGYPEFVSHIESYLTDPEPGSLAALIADTPPPADASPASQVIHWLFAMGDTLAANAFRALAVLSTHPEHLHEVRAEMESADIASGQGIASLKYLGGCLLDTMRLWPTTGLFGRVATRDIEFPSGAVLPEGKQVLIYNVFNHRNRDRIPYADRFSPGEWVSGDAGSDWSYNFFSHGPQGCPGAGLSVFLGQAFLAHVLNGSTPVLRGATLNPQKSLPHSIDLYGISIER